MNRLLSILLISALTLTSCSSLNQLITPTNLETITALREVLNSSTFKAIKTLAKMETQGVESVLPKELQPVLSTLKTLGLGSEIDQVTHTLGRISADVSKESSGIMTDAIKQLNFGDAVAIVVGGESAATGVLKNAMYGSVKKRYSTRLSEELNKEPEVMQYWTMASGAYNLFGSKKIEGTLPDFLAERSVDAMFLAVGKEEAAIRKDPASLGKAVVTKVFDYYQKKGTR